MNDPFSRVLLRWADSNLYWWPFAHRRPASTRALGTHFVLLHALSGLLWAGLPFLILLGLWIGQPSPEAFLIPGAVGAVAAGTYAFLVRSAWNRRAVLHLNLQRQGRTPEPPQPPDPTQFERGVVEPVLILAVLSLGLALVYATENLRGSLAYGRFVAELRAAKAPVTVADIVPPPIPDDRNLAFAPLLRPLSDYTRDAASRGSPVWRDTNGYFRASRMLRIEDDTKSMARFLSDRKKARRAEVAAQTTNNAAAPASEPDPEDRRTSWLAGAPVDLHLWQSYYRSMPDWPGGGRPPQSPAKDVLLALGRHDRDLQELRAAAAARPECRFPLAYDQGYALILAPLAPLKQYASFLRLRAAALLEDKRPDEALADTLLAFRLGDSLADQPILISVLVRISIDQLALQPVWEGCLQHHWNEAQLASLQSTLATRNHPGALQRALEGERILSTSFYDGIARGDHRGLSQVASDAEASGLDTLIRLMPRGWVRHNQVAHGRYVRALVDDLAHAPNHAMLAAGDTHLFRLIKRNSFFTVLAGMLAPALDHAYDKIYEAEATRRLALVGLALERHRLATGSYPDSLAALSPRFLDTLPVDPMDGQPLRYTRKPDGDFSLHSVGIDHTDDGGLRHDPNRRAASAADPRRNTDIVWR